MASEDDFKQAMHAAGVDPPPDLLADGALHRYSSGGDRSKNSWYILFADDPAASGVRVTLVTFSEPTPVSSALNLVLAPADKAVP